MEISECDVTDQLLQQQES